MPALRQSLPKVRLQQPLLRASLDELGVSSARTVMAGAVSEDERENSDERALPSCESCASFIICDDGIVCASYVYEPGSDEAE